MIGALVLGGGKHAFDGRPPGSLELLDTRTWDDSDNVLMRYGVCHPNA